VNVAASAYRYVQVRAEPVWLQGFGYLGQAVAEPFEAQDERPFLQSPMIVVRRCPTCAEDAGAPPGVARVRDLPHRFAAILADQEPCAIMGYHEEAMSSERHVDPRRS
jgi:hypothetical protein